ncbi:sulfotransferase domain-containing protein [Telmatocola sphagniphila]|uniref:Sulfotransferase domain-containing protein n=1 Tax=Telmatocola sphagniphila TaxID=1123043 RepID=A0A8E6BAI2_9BACT|nr:sulfotransferase domain-containing protein [Telmatocola sphagniphila]QVL33573.1 sulfotransferase domain-containing protein [Telmatocola sphagniphila]
MTFRRYSPNLKSFFSKKIAPLNSASNGSSSASYSLAAPVNSTRKPSLPPLRLAIISTPRSGNTWLRHLLSRYYRLEQAALHIVNDRTLAGLPENVALQIHWRKEPGFSRLLSDQGFQIVTLARHPLDVLISILHFCLYDYQTDNWLLGKGGSEEGIRTAMPRSRAFIEYCKSSRAFELLSVTSDWWENSNSISLRYEDLVKDTSSALLGISDQLGPPRCRSVETVLSECSLGKLRQTNDTNHFWKGRAGLWRELLPKAEAEEILSVLSPICQKLGYECHPDLSLSDLAADNNWIRYVGTELKQTLEDWREKHLIAHNHGQSLTRDLNFVRTEKHKLEEYLPLEGFPMNAARMLHKMRLKFYGIFRFLKVPHAHVTNRYEHEDALKN